ncbi:tyrosine-type recombinase/integrase [Clostridium sp. 19966]|uniref:tyrosine-type recombinase/integrase n=1 Tax=Clostridium sp. 19966 TaxID=2768166 RepID=UPI0028DE5DE3|nr:tyrosine-type recombinase/integrase [Clostridium sp. 19966]MDT8716029.1 tyrosine-type recombinase/integrase [Clostridium sp. 19966]
MNKAITPFSIMIEDFIAFKRCENYKYKSEEITLWSFNNFLNKYNLEKPILSQALISKWCSQRFNESRKSISNRVATIRQFMIYLSNRGYDVYIPDTIKNAFNKTFVPYIFSNEEMKRIFQTVDNLQPGRQSNSDIVYPVLFRVLYGCGLRITEALELKIEDVDIENGILVIKNAKFDKKRIVPMSESLTMVCQQYFEKYLANINKTDFFFRNKYGGRKSREAVSKMFRKILWKSGIPYYGKGKGPRLHDLRHCFCCHSIKHMSDQGIDLYCALPVLSTYIGHSSIQATERYIRLSKEIYPDIETKTSSLTGKIYPEVYDE